MCAVDGQFLIAGLNCSDPLANLNSQLGVENFEASGTPGQCNTQFVRRLPGIPGTLTQSPFRARRRGGDMLR